MMKALALLAAAAACVTLIAGCNTIAGVGKDVKATGSAVEKAAEKSKPK